MTEESVNQILADLSPNERATIAKEVLAKIVAAEELPKENGIDAEIKAWGSKK